MDDELKWTADEARILIEREQNRACWELRKVDWKIMITVAFGCLFTTSFYAHVPEFWEAWSTTHRPWEMWMQVVWLLVNSFFNVRLWVGIHRSVAMYEMDKIVEEFKRRANAIAAQVE